MTYTPPPSTITAGTDWNVQRAFEIFVVENIKSLNARIGAGNLDTHAINEVLYGLANGGSDGLPLTNGGLVIGTNGAPRNLPVGSNGQRLMSVNGVIQWGTP